MLPVAETARQGPEHQEWTGQSCPGRKSHIPAAYQRGRQAVGECLIIDQIGPSGRWSS